MISLVRGDRTSRTCWSRFQVSAVVILTSRYNQTWLSKVKTQDIPYHNIYSKRTKAVIRLTTTRHRYHIKQVTISIGEWFLEHVTQLYTPFASIYTQLLMRRGLYPRPRIRSQSNPALGAYSKGRLNISRFHTHHVMGTGNRS